jgi:hypothetical protein
MAIAADRPLLALVPERDPPGYRIGRPAVQWNRRGPPRDEFQHGGIARRPRQILPRRSVFDGARDARMKISCRELCYCQ